VSTFLQSIISRGLVALYILQRRRGDITTTLKTKQGTGWSNLFGIIKSTHKDYESIMEDKASYSRVPFKVQNEFSWVELVVMKSFVLLSPKFERKLRDMLPSKFGIVFDGWTEECKDNSIASFSCHHKTAYENCLCWHFNPFLTLRRR
jgi:hypothetical protein